MKLAAAASLLATSALGHVTFTGGSVDTNDAYQITSIQSRAFKVDQVTMLPSIKGTDWGPGNAATITVTGKAIKDQIQAGNVKYQIYQSFVKSFTSSGNAPYYTCDNKGCDADEPVALKWTNESQQNGAEEDFVLHFQAALPKVVPSTESPNKTPSFRIVVWGEDQRHEPYDFSTTINLKYEEKQPISLSSELLQVRCQSTDHCLELEIPNGFESPFWRDMGYKYKK